MCSFCQTVLEVCYLIPQTNIGTLVVSIVAIIGLILAKELNAYLGKKIPIPIPVELLAVSIIHTVYALPSKDKHSCAPALTHPQILYMSYYLFLQIVVATIISWQANLNEKYGVDVVGHIPSG